MTTKILSKQALEIIDKYEHLNFGNKPIACPYFNNRCAKARGALSVLVGKGTPEEIEEEAKLMAIRERIDLEKMDEEGVKKFLVDHNLGIDCSGLACHILDSEIKEKTGKPLKNFLKPIKRGILDWFRFKFRFLSNINVSLLADDKNSKRIELKNIEPGDFIVFLKYGKEKNRYHILIIEKTESENEKLKAIHYIHTLRWRKDGQYNHGIKRGHIEIINLDKNILEQNWVEGGGENETLKKAEESGVVEARRIKY